MTEWVGWWMDAGEQQYMDMRGIETIVQKYGNQGSSESCAGGACVVQIAVFGKITKLCLTMAPMGMFLTYHR